MVFEDNEFLYFVLGFGVGFLVLGISVILCGC